MKYLIPLVLFLSSCAGIQEVFHPIDDERQRQLVERESPVSINLLDTSILAGIILVLLVGLWFLAWKKTQKRVEGDSST